MSHLPRPSRCAQCDYSLEGLGPEGKCPECGFGFSPQHFVLYGWVHQIDGSQNLREPISIYGYALILLMTVVGIALRFLSLDSDARDLGLQLALSGPILLPLFLFIGWRAKRAQGENAGPWQLRIGPEGWGIRFGPGEVKLNPWQRDVTVEARRISSTKCLFSVVRTKKMPSWMLAPKDTPIASAAIKLDADLQDLVPLVEQTAAWLGTCVDRRLSDRKDWIVRARAPV